MPYHYIISARNVRSNGQFGSEPDQLRFLRVPATLGRLPRPSDEIGVARWVREVTVLANRTAGGKTGSDGDVLIWVHGYNNGLEAIMNRQVLLVSDLAAAGWSGAVVSFDWPSDDSTLNYLEDRTDASKVAKSLVEGGIARLNDLQQQNCKLNVHLLGHSTGAYVIVEAFEQAKRDGDLFKSNWRVDQIGFIAGDVSADVLKSGAEGAESMFARCVRVTNYFSGADHVLAVSNAKRFGASPRAGRVGAPREGRDPKVANVNCLRYFEQKNEQTAQFDGTYAHSWYIGDPVWARDWAIAMNSGLDRNAIPTRALLPNGDLELRDAPRGAREALWSASNPSELRRMARRIGR